MIVYKFDILEALKRKGYSSYRLRKEKLIGESQITKIRSGELASKETLDRLCEMLDMQPGDFLEHKKG